MKQILTRYMNEGADVRVITSAMRNGNSVGITGKILAVTDDSYNPAVIIEWTSNKSIPPTTGTVAYGIRHIVTVQKWEPRTTNSDSSSLTSSAAQWQGAERSPDPSLF